MPFRRALLPSLLAAAFLAAAPTAAPAADNFFQKTGKAISETFHDIGVALKRTGQAIKRDLGIGSYGYDPKAKSKAGIVLSLKSGAPGTALTVNAAGLPHNAGAVVAVGATADKTVEIAQGVATKAGELNANVKVPEDAAPGSDLVFVVTSADDKVRLVSRAFHVTKPAVAKATPASATTKDKAADTTAKPDTVKSAGAGVVTVVGTLASDGVECPALHGDDGKLYTLTPKDLSGHAVGDHVKVEGTIETVSICMQGTTLKVTSITAAK